MSKLGQEPAFPGTQEIQNSNFPAGIIEHKPGMNKRFYVACCAMQGILAGRKEPMEKYGESLARMSFVIADAMLEEEEKP